MTIVDPRSLAERILADTDARTPGSRFREPLTLTTDQAYAVQSEVARLREERGENVVGYKVGCTSRAIQEQLGVHEPIFGRLFSTERHPSGSRLCSENYANLAIEGELAVRLAADLPAEAVSVERYRKSIDAVFPVIELHHYVLPRSWPARPWLIASNGMNAGFVSADENSGHADPTTQRHHLRIQIDGDVVGEADDSEAVVSPVESLRWLAGACARLGLTLRKGQIILTGSPLNLFPATSGSRVLVDAGSLGASRVEIL